MVKDQFTQCRPKYEIMGGTTSQGGPWAAVNSLWAYAHRALHILGVSAIDDEELALLSAPLVRVHLQRRWGQPLLLCHSPTSHYPDEPLGWAESSNTSYESTLFFLHFDTSDGSNPDRAKLATAAPMHDAPRSWFSVNEKTGRLSLTGSESSAATFDVIAGTQKGPPRFALQFACDTGHFLTVSEPSYRARVVGIDKVFSTRLSIHLVPLPPTLSLASDIPSDPTIAAVFGSPLIASIRIQSKARGFHLAAKPGLVVAAARSRTDTSWEPVTLQFDYYTKSALICDGRGAPLYVSDVGIHSVPDGWPQDKPGLGRSRHDRFGLRYLDDDDDAVVIMSKKGFLSARGGGRIELSKDTSPGEQEQFVLHIALPSQTGERSPRVQLNVRENGAREVFAGISVAANPDTIFEVLSDYNGFKDFMKDASESEVIERRNDRELSIRMVQCHSFLMLTIPISMTLDVLEEPGRSVTLNLIRGFGVREYKGVWEIIPGGNCQSRVTITLRVATTVPAPGFLLNNLIANATAESLVQVQEECQRRQAAQKQQ